MTETKLAELMQEGAAAQRVDAPDLGVIRRGGGRIRRRRRAGLGAAALAVVGVVGGVPLLTGHLGSQDSTAIEPSAPDHQVTGLSSYEKRVLAQVPGSFEVDGTVVVPSTPATSVHEQLGPDRLGQPIRALGFHAYAGGALLDAGLPAFMQHRNPPKDSQVVADEGEASIGCVTFAEAPQACQVSVMGQEAGHTYYLYGLGTGRFLDPGAEMEVFTDDDYTGRTWHASVIGGFDGTTATRVVITMVNGETADATVDSGQISAGDTLFWASLPAEAAGVTAYDADGQVVAEHQVRSCHSPVDCEVR